MSSTIPTAIVNISEVKMLWAIFIREVVIFVDALVSYSCITIVLVLVRSFLLAQCTHTEIHVRGTFVFVLGIPHLALE